jgi:hypothetical protein
MTITTNIHNVTRVEIVDDVTSSGHRWTELRVFAIVTTYDENDNAVENERMVHRTDLHHATSSPLEIDDDREPDSIREEV